MTPLHVDEPAPAALVGVELFFFFSYAAALSRGLQRYLGAVFFFLLAMSCARPRSVAAGAAMEPITVARSPLQLYAIAEAQRGASAASQSNGVWRTARSSAG